MAADAPSALDAKERIDCAGRWISPGLIDCHTHLVYGGNRAHEFEQRLAGLSYEEITRAGGGIVLTVKATRKASTDELVAAALPKLMSEAANGPVAPPEVAGRKYAHGKARPLSRYKRYARD